MNIDRRSRLALALAFCHIFATCLTRADAPDIQSLLRQMDDYPHTKRLDLAERGVTDHEVGLGALQKVRGEWRFKRSERLSGTLRSYTWQIDNEFSSAEMKAKLVKSIDNLEGATELFSCDGRACGRAVQWANRVFNQRILFGREDSQHYSVFALQGERAGRLLVYSGERTADRQYLHVEWLEITP